VIDRFDESQSESAAPDGKRTKKAEHEAPLIVLGDGTDGGVAGPIKIMPMATVQAYTTKG